MKLNPPASSSDLEAARAIARRLHQRARGTEGTDLGPAVLRSAPDEGRPPTLTSGPPSPAPASPRERQLPRELPELQPEPPELQPEIPELQPEAPELQPEPPELEPEPPEIEPEAPELEPMPPGGYTAETGSLPSSGPEEAGPAFEPEPPGGYTADTGSFEPGPPAPPEGFEPEPPGGYVADTGSFQPEPPGGGAVDDALVDDALSELTGPPEEPGLEGLEPPSVSPEDLIAEEPAPIEAEAAGPGGGPATAAEDLVEIPAPSWDDVADSCLALAPAHGAMLVDPAGQVLAARGDWPEPGPQAIAGRLVSMMEKKLRDAPTRSVSAPLAGQHLTAWRVPADEGYLTVVFMGAAPLRADVRPSIDATIQASAG
ncbi:MAG: hypothetical protein LJF15_06770 [Acidobacteria bacterium]|nr:hypothetical protein [Acidobacteriota bacterium]